MKCPIRTHVRTSIPAAFGHRLHHSFPVAGLALRHLLVVVAMAFALSSTAQSVFVKAAGGVASQWKADGAVGAGKIAVGYEHELSQTLAIAPSIGFTTRGWRVKGVQTPDMLFDDAGNMLDGDGNITDDPAQQAQRFMLDAEGRPVAPLFSSMHRAYTTNYVQLDIPLNYYVRLFPREYIVLTAGVWGAVGVAGKRKTEGDGRAAGGRKLRYTDPFFKIDGARRFDAGVKLGAGFQFPSSLTVNAELEMGLIPTNVRNLCPEGMAPEAFIARDPFGGRNGRTYALTITVAYRLNKR